MRSGDLASRPRARVRDFGKARRHSRWVRFAKVAIPLGSLLGIAAVSAVAYLDPFRQIEGLTMGDIGVNGTNVTMESPKLTGFNNENRPYEVTATAATQDLRQPNMVKLQDLRARIVTDERGSVARLQADIGILDTKAEKLNLRQDVRVTTEAGQEVQLRSAAVDFKAGTVVSREPVIVNLGNGVIRARGLRVSENGKVMQFKGRVRTTFNQSAASDAPAPATPDMSSAAPSAQPASVDP